MTHKVVAFFMALFLVGASGAQASVFLNGVKIDGMTDKKIEGADVLIDKKGDIYITAKGYEVQKVATPSTTQSAPALSPVTSRYFVIAETNAPGMTQYDVDLFVNDVWIKRISHKDEQTVLEISEHLHIGRNTVHFAATKSLKGKRESVSKKHTLKVMVGRGAKSNNTLTIQATIGEQVYNASTVEHQSNEFIVMGN